VINTEIVSIDQIELRGFARTVAELEWLLLILVLLYFVVPGTQIVNEWNVVIAMTFFAVFIISFRYTRLFVKENRWKLAIDTWVVNNTGGISSPILNLYLLVLVTSAITLGKITTFRIYLDNGGLFLSRTDCE
jgi:hypothetical protein